jgi:hypothetical protein
VGIRLRVPPRVPEERQAAIKLYTRRGYVVVDDTCPPVDALLGKQRYLMVKSL